jgi:hypothetical protein
LKLGVLGSKNLVETNKKSSVFFRKIDPESSVLTIMEITNRLLDFKIDLDEFIISYNSTQ